MPIANVRDAVEVEERLYDILGEYDAEKRVSHIRALFVETLDWQYADLLIPLHNVRNEDLPSDAHLIASRENTRAVYIPLTNADSDRVTAAAVNAAASSLSDTLDDNLLLLFTNQDGDQFHIVRRDLTQARPRLQRMVARRGEHHRTIVQQLANMWDDYGRKGVSLHQATVSAFSVEPVTTLFFNEYRRVFEAAKNAITGFENERDLHLFTQTLFNRLMFVYFISRKGWLSFPDEDGNGDTDYLNALLRDYERGKTADSNFYYDRLRLLFFAGLNNDKSEDLTEYPDALRLIGKVPFLNGGLFEMGDTDARSDIYVPDDAIKPILTDLFDRFNFTVMESTPYDTEVAVDPEMMGKVFEELVNERHESGAYYTPRPVVSFMCRESLKGFLLEQDTGLSDQTIAAFVDEQDTDDITDISQAERLASALNRVAVVDPACGSGAYLLGMMQELVTLRTCLFNIGLDDIGLYNLKLGIIRRNLYGADIDKFAVNIAMLRLWLSLAIEYEGENPDPLPNLDFKIACGDSLLAPDPSPQNYGDLFGDFIRQFDLGGLKAKHMQTTEQTEKDSLKAKIEDARQQIRAMLGDAAGKGAIDWRVEFAEVMGDGGFDVVIGNPPYVEARSSSISKELKDAYRARLQSDWGETLPRGSDLLMYFYPRSVQLLKGTGYGCFITQNAWLSTDYGKKFQSFSIGRFSFIRIIDSTARFFANAKSQNINAVITAFTRDEISEIEYGIADGDLSVTFQGTICARSDMKWGHLIGMPHFLQEIMSKMSSMSRNQQIHYIWARAELPSERPESIRRRY